MQRKLRHSTTVRVTQLLNLKKVVLATSIIGVVVCLLSIYINLSNSEKVYAAGCSTTYELNWADPTTWTVNCGTVNASNWTVKNDSCNYYSPVTNVGGAIGGPTRTTDISVRVNQSGNLTSNDYAYIIIYVNGAVYSTNTARGDTGAAVFSVSTSISVPSAGNFQVRVATKTDKNTEFWQIKNGDVTACVQSLAPLPVMITSFKGQLTSEGAQFKWITAAEVNNDHFTLLRSIDAQNYVEIGRIPGNGTSSVEHHYSFTDSETPQGICYYMLSQTDYDGKTEKFGPIVIRKSKNSNADYNGTVFPNPFKTHFTVTFDSPKDQVAHFSLLDLKGSILDETVLEVNSGTNNFSFSPTKPLKSGLYLVRIQNGNEQLALCKVFKE